MFLRVAIIQYFNEELADSPLASKGMAGYVMKIALTNRKKIYSVSLNSTTNAIWTRYLKLQTKIPYCFLI